MIEELEIDYLCCREVAAIDDEKFTGNFFIYIVLKIIFKNLVLAKFNKNQ